MKFKILSIASVLLMPIYTQAQTIENAESHANFNRKTFTIEPSAGIMKDKKTGLRPQVGSVKFFMGGKKGNSPTVVGSFGALNNSSKTGIGNLKVQFHKDPLNGSRTHLVGGIQAIDASPSVIRYAQPYIGFYSKIGKASSITGALNPIGGIVDRNFDKSKSAFNMNAYYSGLSLGAEIRLIPQVLYLNGMVEAGLFSVSKSKMGNVYTGEPDRELAFDKSPGEYLKARCGVRVHLGENVCIRFDVTDESMNYNASEYKAEYDQNGIPVISNTQVVGKSHDVMKTIGVGIKFK